MVKPLKQKLWSVTTPSRGKENICPGNQFDLTENMDVVIDETAEEEPQMCEANQVFPTLNEAKLRNAISSSPPDKSCATSFRNLAMTEVKIQVTSERKRKFVEVESRPVEASGEEMEEETEESYDNYPWSTTQYFNPAWEAQIKATKVIPWG